MNQKEQLGWTLFTIGFLVAAATAMRIPPLWEAFVPGIIMACGGALIARQGALGNADGSDEELALDTRYLPLTLATSMIRNLSRIDDHTNERTAKEIIEEVQNGDVVHFVEQRRAYLKEYGASSFAQFFGSFAKAERNVNRAWSALVDDHRPEMIASIGLAKKALNEVVVFFQENN